MAFFSDVVQFVKTCKNRDIKITEGPGSFSLT
jgi:hypothetical protein